MINLDNDIRRIKTEVLSRIAELAFSDRLEPNAVSEIPFEMIAGREPHFRCCIYKEREIITQRTRLAMGKMPNGVEDKGNVITVIPSACEGCPITRYRVTENCQKCLTKSCQKACPFGAISMTGRGAYIEQDKCKECGRCAAACPYNAIADLVRPCKRSCPVGAINIGEDKLAFIDDDKCISCGSCMKNCPFSAISDRSLILPVIEGLRDEKRYVAAVVAPALEGQFGPEVTMGKMRSGLLALGFDAAYEVALGADAVAKQEAEELAEVIEKDGKMTTSCCPAFVNMLYKHFPRLESYMSTTGSPMVAIARKIKAEHPGALVVFIGPCVAKKTEVKLTEGADYALTTEEIYSLFNAKNVVLEDMEDLPQEGSIYGKKFSEAGGVTGAVLRVLEEEGLTPALAAHRANGAVECKKALTMLASGRFPSNFIEGMACEGGCMNGPANLQNPKLYAKTRQQLFAEADGRGVVDNVLDAGFPKVDIHRVPGGHKKGLQDE